MSHKIKVALRTRPLSMREIDEGYPMVVQVARNVAFITDIRVPEKPAADSRHRHRKFDFDHTFWLNHSGDYGATQEEVYNEMGPSLEKSVLEGYNACLLAYGQSGTGKTHTMLGTKADPGLIPRLCQNIWTKLNTSQEFSSFKMEVSFMEIYREKVRDLLTLDNQHKLLREHPTNGPHVQDLTKVQVTEEITWENLLWEGEKRRANGKTDSNRRSSRSHAIWTLYLTYHKDNGSKLIANQVHLVDLAGSEKAEFTTSKNLLAEGADINRSLVSLGNVISSLSEKAPYIPYRDSALTWLLKDSIGGNSRTYLLITASPASCCHAQTLNSLRFAQRARLVENLPTINLTTDSDSSSSIASLFDIRKDIARLANILKVAQSNGGILRGLTPRNGWNRLIEAIESWNHVEKKNLRATSTETSTSTTATTTSTSTMTSASAKSLNDVMVQRNQEYSPADIQCYEDARQSSVSVPNSPCHQTRSSSSEEVFIPKSSSIKCLTWSQSEIESIPEVIPSDSDEYISPPSSPHVHHLKNVYPVHIPMTHNLDAESRIHEKIHASFNCDYPSAHQTVPKVVKNECANNSVVIRHQLPTLVNPQPLNIFECSESSTLSSNISNCSHSNSPCGDYTDHDFEFHDFQSPKPKLVLAKGAGKKRIHRSGSKIKEFITAKPISLKLLESTDEYEFSDCLEVELNQSANKHLRTVNFQRQVKQDHVHTPMLQHDDILQLFCSDSESASGSDSGTKKSSSSSSSYASLIFQKPVGPVKIVEESVCQFNEDHVREFKPIDLKLLEKRVAAVSIQFGEMTTDDCQFENVDKSGEEFNVGMDGVNKKMKKPFDGLSTTKFRSFYLRELQKLEQIGKELEFLKCRMSNTRLRNKSNRRNRTQRYDVLKPYLKKIEELQKEDFSQPDPEIDAQIEQCSGWNVDIEFNKVQNEMLAISQILKNNNNGLLKKRRDSSSTSNHSNPTSSTSMTSDSNSPTMDPTNSRRGSGASSNVFEPNLKSKARSFTNFSEHHHPPERRPSAKDILENYNKGRKSSSSSSFVNDMNLNQFDYPQQKPPKSKKSTATTRHAGSVPETRKINSNQFHHGVSLPHNMEEQREFNYQNRLSNGNNSQYESNLPYSQAFLGSSYDFLNGSNSSNPSSFTSSMSAPMSHNGYTDNYNNSPRRQGGGGGQEPWKNSFSSCGSAPLPIIYSCPTFNQNGYHQTQTQRYPTTIGQQNSTGNSTGFFVPPYSQFNNFTGYPSTSSPSKMNPNNMNGFKSQSQQQFNFPSSALSFNPAEQQHGRPPPQDPSDFLRQDYGFRLDQEEDSTDQVQTDFSSGASRGDDKYFSSYGSNFHPMSPPHKLQSTSTGSPYTSLDGSTMDSVKYCKNCSTEFCSCEESLNHKMNGDHGWLSSGGPRMRSMGVSDFVGQKQTNPTKGTSFHRSTNIYNPSVSFH